MPPAATAMASTAWQKRKNTVRMFFILAAFRDSPSPRPHPRWTQPLRANGLSPSIRPVKAKHHVFRPLIDRKYHGDTEPLSHRQLPGLVRQPNRLRKLFDERTTHKRVRQPIA